MRPASVRLARTERRSSGSGTRSTRPSRSRWSTSPVMLRGVEPRSEARSPRGVAPHRWRRNKTPSRPSLRSYCSAQRSCSWERACEAILSAPIASIALMSTSSVAKSSRMRTLYRRPDSSRASSRAILGVSAGFKVALCILNDFIITTYRIMESSIVRAMIVDAHLDIAWNAISAGRGFLSPPAPGYLVRRSSLIAGGVGLGLATLYTAPASAGRSMRTRFVYENSHEAHIMAVAQVNYYRSCGVQLIGDKAELESYVGSWKKGRLAAVLLMEGAA